MQKLVLAAAASAFLAIGGVSAASADDECGPDRPTGAMSDAADGTPVARTQDCHDAALHAYNEHERARAQAYRDRTQAYNDGHSDRAAENVPGYRDPNDAPVTLVVRPEPGDPEYPN